MLAGTYAENCSYYKGNELEGLAKGESISLGADGSIKSSRGSVNYVTALSSEFGVLIDRQRTQLASKFDLKDPVNGGRTYLLGVATLDGTLSGATLTNDTQPSGSVGIGCAGPTPAAFTTNVWAEVMPHVNFAKVSTACITIKGESKGKLEIEASNSTLVIGQEKYTANDKRLNENISVSDDGNNPGISYTFPNQSGGSYTLSTNLDGNFESLLILKDGDMVSCSKS